MAFTKAPISILFLVLATQPLLAQDVEPCASTAMRNDSTLQASCKFVLHLRETMPNFVALQSTARYAPAKTSAVRVAPQDTLTAIVTHADGHDSYTDLKRDGNPLSGEMSSLNGVWSLGEFSDQLRALFAVQNQVEFAAPETKKLGARRVKVYPFLLLAENNHSLSVQVGNKTIHPGYRGKLTIDEEKGQPLRLEFETIELPKTLPIVSASIEIAYADTPIADGSQSLLPHTATVKLCLPREDGCSSNITTFSNFRKFRSTSRVLTETIKDSTTK
jgi:hypothetical protein